MTLRHSRGRRPAQRTRTPQLVHLVAPAPDHVPVEAHQEAHLLRGAPPVLGGEGVRARGSATPSSMAPSTTSNSAGSPASWPAVRGRPRCVGPAAVAVHDDGHVPRHELAGVAGRPRPGRVRRRRSAGGCGARPGAACQSAASRTPVPLHVAPRARRDADRAPGATAGTRRPAPLASRRRRGSLASAVVPVPAEQGAEQQQGLRVPGPRTPAGGTRGRPRRPRRSANAGADPAHRTARSR